MCNLFAISLSVFVKRKYYGIGWYETEESTSKDYILGTCNAFHIALDLLFRTIIDRFDFLHIHSLYYIFSHNTYLDAYERYVSTNIF